GRHPGRAQADIEIAVTESDGCLEPGDPAVVRVARRFCETAREVHVLDDDDSAKPHRFRHSCDRRSGIAEMRQQHPRERDIEAFARKLLDRFRSKRHVEAPYGGGGLAGQCEEFLVEVDPKSTPCAARASREFEGDVPTPTPEIDTAGAVGDTDDIKEAERPRLVRSRQQIHSLTNTRATLDR